MITVKLSSSFAVLSMLLISCAPHEEVVRNSSHQQDDEIERNMPEQQLRNTNPIPAQEMEILQNRLEEIDNQIKNLTADFQTSQVNNTELRQKIAQVEQQKKSLVNELIILESGEDPEHGDHRSIGQRISELQVKVNELRTQIPTTSELYR